MQNLWRGGARRNWNRFYYETCYSTYKSLIADYRVRCLLQRDWWTGRQTDERTIDSFVRHMTSRRVTAYLQGESCHRFTRVIVSHSPCNTSFAYCMRFQKNENYDSFLNVTSQCLSHLPTITLYDFLVILQTVNDSRDRLGNICYGCIIDLKVSLQTERWSRLLNVVRRVLASPAWVHLHTSRYWLHHV